VRESKPASEIRSRVNTGLPIKNPVPAFPPNRHRSSLPAYVSLLILAASLSLSCSPDASIGEQAASGEITVAAAANLTGAFTDLSAEFTARTGIRVRLSFGATSDLARQIENGAPFDVFASADVEHVQRLKGMNLLAPGTERLFARGRLVLWTAPGSPFTLNRIEEITRPEVERIALAKPDLAPYGRATVEALRALNLWTQVEPKVIYGESVAQAKQYAATGNAEAAFIPLSLVKANEGVIIEVDERLHHPLDHALAIVRDSQQIESARRFASFTLSPEGQAILERYGYRKAVTGDRKE
jgi:molybdate transport system substrate-binding protein